MARRERYRWRNFGGISKSQQRLGALELHGQTASRSKPKSSPRQLKHVQNGLPHDIRDYVIHRKGFTVTGTLDRRNGRWVWSPVLRLQVGDVVVVRPRSPISSV